MVDKSLKSCWGEYKTELATSEADNMVQAHPTTPDEYLWFKISACRVEL
jgi:hypothetical protein